MLRISAPLDELRDSMRVIKMSSPSKHMRSPMKRKIQKSKKKKMKKAQLNHVTKSVELKGLIKSKCFKCPGGCNGFNTKLPNFIKKL